MECKTCKAENVAEKIVYTCSGCADVGEIADQVGRKLRKEGFATPKASCLIGISAGITPFIEAAKAAETVITIDGCEILCAKKVIQSIGIMPRAIVLTEMGLQKGNTTPSPELYDTLSRTIQEPI